MTQGALTELFQTSSQNITMHIKNIYDEKELLEVSTCKYNLQVRLEGNREVKRWVKFYNLEMIIAKNYLNNEEMQGLDKNVTMFLDYAEEMAKDEVSMYMADWQLVLDEFLKFNRKDILTGSGKISHVLAKQKALKEYELYDAKRLGNVDFDLPEKFN